MNDNLNQTTNPPLNNRKITILYGSQTGNAIDVSERIAFEFQRKWFNINLMSMDEYLQTKIIKNLNNNYIFNNENIIIFVASTTGQGDVPNNMNKFWKFLLRRNLSNNCLSNIYFTTFCLGDSSYRNYNTVGRKLHQRILDLGANKIYNRGLGDDQHDIGYDHQFIPWLNQLSIKLENMYGIPNGFTVIPKDKLTPSKYVIKYYNDNDNDYKANTINKYYAPLVKHIRVTPDNHWQNVHHLTFDITDSDLSYKPGDVLLIYPLNDDIEVFKLCKILNIPDPKTTFISIDYNHNSNIKICKNLSDDLIGLIPPKLSIYELFSKYLDINGVPRRKFFEKLIHFTTNKQHRDKLIEFCNNTSDGQIALYEYNQSESRTFIEVLYDFNSCAMSLDYLISLIPLLKPRKYSISSCMEYYYDKQNCINNNLLYKLKKRKFVEIIVALVEYETPLKRNKIGICSKYIHSLPFIDDNNNDNNNNILIPIWIEKGSFKFKNNWLSSSVLMIGPGTGIAPFRSMSQQRYHLINNNNNSNDNHQIIGKCLIFFGNRNKLNDFFYQNEWNKLSQSQNGSVFKLITAFSRDQNNKIYVTHKMKENSELIWNWISKKKCYIFVAGSSMKMPNDVRNVIIDIIGKYGKKNKKESEKYVKYLERTGKYQSETWT